MTASNVVALVEEDVPQATREEAEARYETIRQAFQITATLLVAAWRARDHVALGYGTGMAGWEKYMEDRYGDFRELRLPTGTRRDRIAAMRNAGMSVGAIQLTPGVGSRGTVSGDLKALRAAGRLDESNVVGLDERRVKAPVVVDVDQAVVPAKTLTAVDLVVAAVAARGAAGMTCLEVTKHLKWRQGPASCALSRAAKRGRVVHAGQYRGGFGVFVVAD